MDQTVQQNSLNGTTKGQEQQRNAIGIAAFDEKTSKLFDWYHTMRANNPVTYNEKNKWWEIFRYEDVLRVVNDYTTFSSEHIGEESAVANAENTEFARTILNMDPPRHRQLRSLVTQAFTPRAVAQLVPRITAIVNEHLDAVAEQGRMDVVADLSYPLPVIVIAEMLGIPPEDRDQFKLWSDAVVGTSEEEGNRAWGEMRDYFKQIIAQRRKQPQDDMVTALLAAPVDGVHLTEPEVLSFCNLLLVAGNETTTNLIGNAILCFDEYPAVMDEIRADFSLLPGAIEEVLRYRSPVQLLVRGALANTVIGDKQIKVGEIIVPWLGSANRDELQFPNPDVFDIRRTSNRHVAFGHGIHFCVGAPLARIESKIALQILLERFTDIRCDHEQPLRYIESSFVYGVKSLPITFRPA